MVHGGRCEACGPLYLKNVLVRTRDSNLETRNLTVHPHQVIVSDKRGRLLEETAESGSGGNFIRLLR